MFSSQKQVENYYLPIVKPNINTRELRINENPMKVEILTFYGIFMFRQKSLEKWGKNNSSLACSCKIEKYHPWGQNFNRDLASLVPSKKYHPSGQIYLSYMDTHGGLLLSFINSKGSCIVISKSC